MNCYLLYLLLISIYYKSLKKNTNTYKSPQYVVNHEPYSRDFLDNVVISFDNNDAEQRIKVFCVGNHSCHIINPTNRIESRAMLFSILETAKANGFKPYVYFNIHLNRFSFIKNIRLMHILMT